MMRGHRRPMRTEDGQLLRISSRGQGPFRRCTCGWLVCLWLVCLSQRMFKAQCFEIVPTTAGRTFLRYRQHQDQGGRIHSWVSHPPGNSWGTTVSVVTQPSFLCPRRRPLFSTGVSVDSLAHPDSDEVVEQESPDLVTRVMDAASSHTQASCTLLGVKSIGVDYGLVRTGLAVTVGYDPKPVTILSDLNNTEVVQEILSIARLEKARKIIVGWPLHKNGTLAEQTNVTLVFAQLLAECTLRELGPSVDVELWDERYTSKEAAARVHARNPNDYLYGSLDAIAACIILENYYHDNGQGRIPLEIEDEKLRTECLAHFHAEAARQLEARRQALVHREERIRKRQEAIERANQEASGAAGNSNKKKKKKRKKK